MNIYIDKIAEIMNTKPKRVDSIGSIFGKLQNQSFINKPSCYVIRDDKDYMQQDKIWEQMNNKNTGTGNSGLGLGGVLLLIFITLKLCKVISWSWVWVLSPLWISLILYLLLTLVFVLIEIKNKL
jgi:hypothetical protein